MYTIGILGIYSFKCLQISNHEHFKICVSECSLAGAEVLKPRYALPVRTEHIWWFVEGHNSDTKIS